MNGKCERENCFGYNRRYRNNCSPLVETYEDDYECPFFKTKKDASKKYEKLFNEVRR